MLSGGCASPTMRVVMRSARPRIAQRNGALKRTQKRIGSATMRVLYRTGLCTARVFGVTSPKSSSSGVITSRLSQPAAPP